MSGYVFYSQTDTEVAVKLVDYYYKKYSTPAQAIAKAMMRIRGSYALAILFRDHQNQIWTARKDSPMIIGVTKGETFIASDVPAILKYTQDIYYVGNCEMACVEAGKVSFFNIDGELVEKETVHITWDANAAERGGFEHFMIKEIHEQPKALQDTLNSLLNDGRLDISKSGITPEIARNISEISIVACGSAWHVGMAAKYVIEDIAKIAVRVQLLPSLLFYPI